MSEILSSRVPVVSGHIPALISVKFNACHTGHSRSRYDCFSAGHLLDRSPAASARGYVFPRKGRRIGL